MSEALPTDPHGQRLCDLFPYRWKWIEADLSGGYSNIQWETNTKFPLKARLLWSKFRDANTLIGVRFGSRTSYALLDIDVNSPFIERLGDITDALTTIGIYETVPLRSSWSGGVHLYIPLPKRVSSFSLACALEQCLVAQGFRIFPGELEVFPNVKSYARVWLGETTEYNAHRLPLQPATGSCLLDRLFEPDDRVGDQLAQFFMRWDRAALCQDEEELDLALSVARSNRRARGKRATGPINEWRNDLEAIIAEGWTGHGQTNQILKEIACYGRVFEGLAGHDLIAYIERIATSRPGYAQYCGHQHQIYQRATLWARAVEKFYWPLGSVPLREGKLEDVDPNTQKAADARRRIAAAFSYLKLNEVFDDLGSGVRWLVRHLCEMAKCSVSTLYKNLDLWHPEHRSDKSPVTPHPEGDTALETAPVPHPQQIATPALNGGVTHQGGGNEAYAPETAPLKNLPPGGQGERGGPGENGGRGFPQPLSDLLPVENPEWGWLSP